MADNRVRFLRGTATEYKNITKDNDAFYFTTDDGRLYIGDKEISGDGSITIDTELSDTSENVPQTKIVKKAIDEKADKAVATTATNGLMSASDKSKLDDVDNTYALKSKYGDTTIDVGRKSGTTVGSNSTAEGYNTTASGSASHAEGSYTTASGSASHAEGAGTTASGYDSHAEGSYTTASGDYSHAGGRFTKALHDHEVAYGQFNESNDDTLFSIGDGTSDSACHNAFEITTTGGKLHDKDIATTDMSLPANGGNADTLDNKHSSDFAAAVNPTLDGEIRLIRSGNNTTDPMIFAWEETIRIRNVEDESAENYTYTDLIVTPDGIYTESMINGVHQGRTKINDGGNADTLGEKSAVDFSQIIELGWSETDTKTAVGIPTKTTIYHCSNWTDFPAGSPDGQGILIAANYNGSGIAGTDSMWVIQFFISARTGVVYKRYIGNTVVREWKEISTTPIKSTGISGTTDQYGNLLLWKVTDTRKPIFFEINGFYAIPFRTADRDYFYYYVGLINCANHEYIPNTAVLGTVYYIEV